MTNEPDNNVSVGKPWTPRFTHRDRENATVAINKPRIDKQWQRSTQTETKVAKTRLSLAKADDPEARCVRAVAEIMRALSGSLDVATNFEVIAQQAQQILAYDALAILLPEAESITGEGCKWIVAFCNPPTVEPRLALPLSDCSFTSALLAAQPMVIADFAVTPAQHAGDRLLLHSLGCAALITPIQSADSVLGGLLLISRTPGCYQAEDAPLATSISDLLALVLAHQRLEQQARALAVVEERNRLAREIHDTLAHSLTSIIINLEALKPYAMGRSQIDAEVLAETEGLARTALAEARRSVMGLQPTPLQHQSLCDTLKPELAGLAKRVGLVTQFYVQGAEQSLTPDVASALFRLAQEAFHNIEKHAAACHVILGLAFEADAIVLTVEDDGVGFIPASVAPNVGGGFGLLSMATRARSLNGTLHVTSHPGHGTTVRATLPYIRSRHTPVAEMLQCDHSAQPMPTAPTIRILIVDNHPAMRQGILRILEGRPDMQVVGEAADGLAAIEQTERLHPDVVLLDLQMPRLSGVEALPRLRTAHPTVEVVVLTMFDQDEQVFACLKAGARSYVLKDAAPETIVAAIRTASHGEASLPSSMTTRVVERFSALAQREVDPDALTERELEILGHMAKGLPYKVIAAQLNVTTHTVQYHVTNILQKLHVGNRGEAVAVAVKRGVIEQVK